jgi:hypothetical protein
LADFQGCGHPDPDHSYEGGRIQYNNGRNNGWLRAGENDEFAVGYYDAADLDFWRQAGPDWTVCDRYFAATMAETYPNRFYQHSAATDRIHNSTATCTLTTIWDRLAAAGVSGKYYYGDIPFTALWGGKYQGISHHYAEFLTDCSAGTLPAVSFVDPRFTDGAPAPPAMTTRTPTSVPVKRSWPRSTTRSHPDRAGPTPCWWSTTTNGAASTTTSRRRRPRTPAPPPHCAAFGFPPWWSLSPPPLPFL